MADTADATIRAIRTVVGSLGIGMAHRTMSLPCILGAETDTPQNVLATADRLHMCGINTGAVATEVIQSHTIGNRPGQQLISEAVDAHPLSADLNATVAPLSSPYPKPAIWPLDDSPPEPHSGRDRLWSHSQYRVGIAMHSSPLPMFLAESEGIMHIGTIGDATLTLHRKVTPFGAMQPEVICLAAASIIPESGYGVLWWEAQNERE